MVMLVLLLMFMYIVNEWFFFFFKQKTAYEMRISDWSSDVCSSDLARRVSGEKGIGWWALAPATCVIRLHRGEGQQGGGQWWRQERRRQSFWRYGKGIWQRAILSRRVDRKSTRLNSSH